MVDDSACREPEIASGPVDQSVTILSGGTRYTTDHDRRDFDRLFDALCSEPWSIRNLLAREPHLAEATNYSGETVIHWFVVENDIEKVKLLHACGAQIDSYALTEACSLGHIQMCELLLCYGVKPDIESCAAQLDLARPAKRIRRRLRLLFRAYGYPLA